RTDWQRSAGLAEVIVPPAGLGDRLETAAGALLKQQRDAVGETNDAGRVICGQLAAERDGRLDLKWPAAIDVRLAAAGGVGLRLHALKHPRQELTHAYRRQTVRRRRR